MRSGSAIRQSALLLLLFLSVFFLAQPPSAMAARTVRVGVFPAAPLVQNTASQPEGLFIDLVEYFARSLDWRLEYVDKPWGELLVDLKRGDIDLLPAVAVTNERREIYDYSEDPPFIDSGVIYTGSDFNLRTVFDLQGKRVAGVRDSIFTDAFLSYAASFGVECDMVFTDDNPSVMQAITDGTVDAGVSIYSLGIELAQRYPVNVTAISFAPRALTFAVPRGKNSDLIEGIDRLMAPMFNDPNSLYSRSFDKWIRQAPPTSIPVWIWWGVGGICLVGALFGSWTIMLRREVAARTKHLEAEISERKQTEKSLAEREEQLRQSQKMEAVGQLAGGIAHDFNNLLTTITGYTELLLTSQELAHSPALADIKEIKQAADRAGSLTRQILAFSRKQTLRPTHVLLNDVLTGMEPLLRRTLGEDIDLATLLHPDLGYGEVDLHQFEQVVMNLALNARDAMPTGGRLTLETANVELDEEYCLDHPGATPGECVMLAVSDTGVGMDQATLEHIFEPFFTTKPPGEGTGLGLATVYGIVKQSRGSINVYSELGKGTSFKVYLPRVAGPGRVETPSASQIPSAIGGRETILVVEDEASLRSLADRILGGLGYKVLVAGGATEALEVLAATEAPVDLLLTDVILPGGMQGNDLALHLRMSRPHLPVLYMSGYTRDAITHAGRLDEGVNYLEKPFTPRVLAAKVRAVLDEARRTRDGD